ncbi:MAG: PEP-CTERM sorting domain-containing protein [Candidatus Omnitrophota bacterium]
MKRTILVALFVLLSVFCAGASFALSIDVTDGSLSDWGVTPGTNWTPTSSSNLFYTVEDQTSYFLYPGYGGQDYDAEAMYTYFDNTNLYFAVVTGFPFTGLNGIRPGDIAIQFGAKTAAYTYGIETTGNGGFSKGTLYDVKTWGLGEKNWGIWNGNNANYNAYLGAPTEILAINGTIWTPGTTNIMYSYYGPKRYIIEGYVPVSAFGDNWTHNYDFRVHWTETCGNDFIEVDGKVAPEPATMALVAFGLAGFVARKKRV